MQREREIRRAFGGMDRPESESSGLGVMREP
jgi:hypothetical protein